MNVDSRAFGGSIPGFYDEFLGPIIFADFAIDIARRVAAARPARVLETAAGSGIATRQLRSALAPEAHLTSTDLQDAMLDVARTKFRAGEQVEFAAVDATTLPFDAGAFDAVVCQFGFMFFPDRDRAYREVRRVLAPGGRLFFSVWDSPANNAFARITLEALQRTVPGGPPPFMTIPFSYAFDAIKDSLVAANFADITASVVRVEKDVPYPAHFARGLIMGSPIGDQLRARGEIDVDGLIETLAQNLALEFGNPGHTVLQALVFSASAP